MAKYKFDEGFGKRLRAYIFGLGLGSLMVYVMFGQRACEWLPKNRVKSSITEKIIVFPDNQMEALNQNGIDEKSILSFIANGKVDFKNSIKNRDDYPKVYIIKGKTPVDVRLQFSLYEDAYITPVHFLEKGASPVQYKKMEGWGEMVSLPRDSALVYIDESNLTQCKARGLASQEGKVIIENLKTSGRINFDKSDLMLTKATQWITFKQNDTLLVNASTIWYKDRITFQDFSWDYKLDCENE